MRPATIRQEQEAHRRFESKNCLCSQGMVRERHKACTVPGSNPTWCGWQQLGIAHNGGELACKLVLFHAAQGALDSLKTWGVRQEGSSFPDQRTAPTQVVGDATAEVLVER